MDCDVASNPKREYPGADGDLLVTSDLLLFGLAITVWELNIPPKKPPSALWHLVARMGGIPVYWRIIIQVLATCKPSVAGE